MTTNFPFDWFRDLLVEDLAPHWLSAAVTDSGLFHTSLGRDWERNEKVGNNLVGQSRLLFVFAEAYRRTDDERYLQAVRHGADFLLEHFFDREYGGFFQACASDGRVTDDRKRSYSHVFVIFGLAHAYDVTKNQRWLQGAIEASETVHTKFRDNDGGICQMMSRDFKDIDTYRNQNPIMHLTEALLVLADKSGQNRFLDLAQSWIDFLFPPTFARQDKALLEFYDFNWQPLTEDKLPANESGMIIIGHQLEWAYLLSRAVEMGLSESYLKYADFGLQAGLDIGYDPEYGGVMCKATATGKVREDYKGFWEQAETIRALLNFTVRHRRSDLLPFLDKTVDFFQRYQYDPVYGGIYPAVSRDGEVLTSAKGSPYKVDYHTVSMIEEVLRLEKMAE